MSDSKTSEKEDRQYADSITKTVREPLIFLNQDLRVISASRSFYDAFKTKPEDTLGWLIYDIGNKQWDIPELRQLLETLLPQNTTLDDYEVEHEFADLGRRTMLLNAREIQRKSGKDRLILLAIEDITGRKQAEKALKESAERFRLAAEVAEMYGWEFDLINRVFTPSENAEKAVCFPVPKRISEVLVRIHPDDYSKVRQTMDRAVEECGEFQVEYRINPSPDEEFWVFSAGVVITEPDRRPTHVVGVTQNITRRKQSEAELHQLNKTLEQRVAERTELAEARAKQLQSLSVELIKAEEKERRRISELLHDDLQQMLASAKLHLECAIQNLPKTPALSVATNLVKESIRRSRRLSHELSPPLLQYSSLLDALDWLTKHMESRFGLKVRLEAKTECYFDSVPLKFFLFRAVQEFLFNVVKHAEVESVEITLSYSGDCSLISVRDQGRGFNPDTLETSNPKTNLGLLSIKERANYMGIDLTIESAPGCGNRITLAIPHNLAQDTAPGLFHCEEHPKSVLSHTTEKSN